MKTSSKKDKPKTTSFEELDYGDCFVAEGYPHIGKHLFVKIGECVDPGGTFINAIDMDGEIYSFDNTETVEFVRCTLVIEE